MSARIALGLLAVALFGCATLDLAWGLPRISPCVGVALPPDAIPGGDFRVREQVRLAEDDFETRVSLVIERRGGRLVLVGLNEFGAKLFSLVQDGAGIQVESELGRALQLDPETLLVDWQTARGAGVDGPERVEVRRPGCAHRAIFVRVERSSAGVAPVPRGLPDLAAEAQRWSFPVSVRPRASTTRNSRGTL